MRSRAVRTRVVVFFRFAIFSSDPLAVFAHTRAGVHEIKEPLAFSMSLAHRTVMPAWARARARIFACSIGQVRPSHCEHVARTIGIRWVTDASDAPENRAFEFGACSWPCS